MYLKKKFSKHKRRNLNVSPELLLPWTFNSKKHTSFQLLFQNLGFLILSHDNQLLAQNKISILLSVNSAP